MTSEGDFKQQPEHSEACKRLEPPIPRQTALCSKDEVTPCRRPRQRHDVENRRMGRDKHILTVANVSVDHREARFVRQLAECPWRCDYQLIPSYEASMTH